MKQESKKSESGFYDFDQDIVFMSTEKSNKKRIQQSPNTSDSRAFPIEIIELKVSYVGEKISLVSLKCRKRRDTMVKICEVFKSLKLNVVTANITAVPETLFKTLFIQVCTRKNIHFGGVFLTENEEEKECRGGFSFVLNIDCESMQKRIENGRVFM
uniref:Plant bHLH transcription factor ACT-like domain-containing protein n=1 Tax=Lactuca sativa TaxID=4236 RepID=A0A9R1WMD4_LACSA|nr:hypothetical protein LSAT_V11C100021300 [Lactuca sativa]